MPEVKQHRAEDAAKDDHRLEPDQAALVELPPAHPGPAVVIGVGRHKAGEQKEKSTAK